MTKKVDTWMPLLVDKYLGDTTHLTTEQHGAYLLLLMAMWKRDGELPASDAQLSAIARMQPTKWKAAKPVLMEFFTSTEDGSGITQKRLSEELERANAMSARKAAAGAVGAQKRWQAGSKSDGNANASANGRSDGTAIADASLKQWQTGTPIPTPSATQIPDTASAVSSREPGDGVRTREGAATARGEVGKALKRAGVDLTRINLSDPRITALIDQGATPEEFEGLGREAVEKGIANPVGWICTALTGRRQQAAAITLAPGAPPPDPWTTRAGVEGIAATLGLPKWDECETFDAYRGKVRRAHQQRNPQPEGAVQ